MAINLQSTGNLAASNVRLLVYGQAGAGKTSLIKTLPNPVVLSAEGGLLSIADANLPFIEIKDMADLAEAYEWLAQSDEAKQFESVALDSISEIGEVLRAAEKKEKNQRPAQATAAKCKGVKWPTNWIRTFRDLPGKHVFSAKVEKTQDEMGRILYSPSMPGQQPGQALPFF